MHNPVVDSKNGVSFAKKALENKPNCKLSKPLFSTYVIHMNSETETSDETSEETNEVKIAELKTGMSNVDLIFKMLEKSDIREVTSRRDGNIYRVVSSIIGDETGIVTLPLWNEAIDTFEIGKTYHIKNAHTGLYRGNLRLKISNDTEISEDETEISNVNMDNDISEEYHGRPRSRHSYQGYSNRSYGINRDRFRGGGRNRRRPRY